MAEDGFYCQGLHSSPAPSPHLQDFSLHSETLAESPRSWFWGGEWGVGRREGDPPLMPGV